MTGTPTAEAIRRASADSARQNSRRHFGRQTLPAERLDAQLARNRLAPTHPEARRR